MDKNKKTLKKDVNKGIKKNTFENIKKDTKNKVNTTKKKKDIKQKKENKKFNIDKKKLSIFIILVCVIVFLITIIILNKGINITDETDISKLDAKKNSEQIVSKYNENGMKDKFLTDYDAVQTGVAMYMLNNMSNESDSLENILSSIRQDLESETFKILGTTKPNNWNGKWTITDSGTLKFKFSSKNIEPTWINDEGMSNKIILN